MIWKRRNRLAEVFEFHIATEQDMENLGAELAKLIGKVRLVTLSGDLGAGKTTLVRGLLHQLGHHGAVKSPTFTLVEPYQLGELNIYHFDLYRLEDPEELEYLNAREYLESGDMCLIEWPEKGAALLPQADVKVSIHKVVDGRNVRVELQTGRGLSITNDLQRITGEFA